MCCQVEVSATSWSLVQRSPTDCDASLSVIKKPQEWGSHGPRWAAAPQKTKQNKTKTLPLHNCIRQIKITSVLCQFKSYKQNYDVILCHRHTRGFLLAFLYIPSEDSYTKQRSISFKGRCSTNVPFAVTLKGSAYNAVYILVYTVLLPEFHSKRYFPKQHRCIL